MKQLLTKFNTTLFLIGLMAVSSSVNANNTQLTNTEYYASPEMLKLKKLEQHIRDSVYLINDAQALQSDDARYKFNYEALRQDLSNIVQAINRSINQNKRSQMPRVIEPLILEY